MIRFFLFTIMSLPFLQGLAGLSTDPKIKSPTERHQASGMAGTKAPWVKNAGQWDDDILYVAHTFSGNVIINQEKEILYAIPVDSTSGYVLKERFVGTTNRYVQESPTGDKKSPSAFNYFMGNDQSKWKSNVASYEVMDLGEVWEGVRVKLNAYNSNVEKLFYVQPNIDPASIQIAVDGSEQLQISPKEKLLVSTPAGAIVYSAPIAY